MQTRAQKTVPAGATRKTVAPAPDSTWQPQVFRQLLRSGAIQAKLTVSQPGDPLEQEADQVAEEVMRMPVGSLPLSPADSGIQRKCSCSAGGGHTCDKCSKEEEKKVQTKEAPGRTPSVTPRAEAHVESLRGGGQPLPRAVRSFFEPRFGRDFSGVRVHADSRANEAASAVQARAFTLGKDVVFGAGEYAPQSAEGQRLLAHELAHVGQQGQAGQICRKASAPKPAATARDRKTPERPNDNCTSIQRCKAVERVKPAQELVKAALRAVAPVARGEAQSGPIIDLLNKHFHTSTKESASQIQDRFNLILGELSRKIEFFCHQHEEQQEPAECKAQDRGEFAGAFTAHTPGARVDLCKDYYDLPCDEQARILVHELAHHVPGFHPDRYVHRPEYQTPRSPGGAMENNMGNADSYAQFAKEVSGPSPCTDCSTAISRENKKY